jgi:hypothetical protein
MKVAPRAGNPCAPPSHREGLRSDILGPSAVTQAPQRVGQHISIVRAKAGIESRLYAPVCGSGSFA